MSSSDQNLSTEIKAIDGSDFKVGIVKSLWNIDITQSLYDACFDVLKNHGVDPKNIEHIEVPGTFELPLGAKILLGKERLDAIICLGCVITGETKHDEYIAHATASAISQLNIIASKPIIFGVLTPRNKEQAEDRAGGKYGNKGVEAAQTALQMISLQKSVHKDNKRIGFS